MAKIEHQNQWEKGFKETEEENQKALKEKEGVKQMAEEVKQEALKEKEGVNETGEKDLEGQDGIKETWEKEETGKEEQKKVRLESEEKERSPIVYIWEESI